MSPERRLVPAQLLDQRRGQPGPGGPARRSARREACGVSVSEAKGAVTEQKGVQKRVREVGTQSSPGEQEAQRGGPGSSSCFGVPPSHSGSAPHRSSSLQLLSLSRRQASGSPTSQGPRRAVPPTLHRDWIVEVL